MDSRLRGNDGREAGNDGREAGNDGREAGNDGREAGNDGSGVTDLEKRIMTKRLSGIQCLTKRIQIHAVHKLSGNGIVSSLDLSTRASLALSACRR
ncbi:hypothetical protein [Endozoicomonas sp. ALC066]|uniref:hypothetical protein n=1 Tax=Endozoicomonas sp. ALC066 TaxID=3403078 RepID=UPI003BB6B5D1